MPKISLSESQLQIEVIKLLHQFARHDIMYFAVPNEGERSGRFANRMKAQGMLAGTADLFLVIDGRAHALELKTEVGGQSIEQGLFEVAFKRAGGIYHLAKGLDEAVVCLTDIEAFKPGVNLVQTSARKRLIAQLKLVR